MSVPATAARSPAPGICSGDFLIDLFTSVRAPGTGASVDLGAGGEGLAASVGRSSGGEGLGTSVDLGGGGEGRDPSAGLRAGGLGRGTLGNSAGFRSSPGSFAGSRSCRYGSRGASGSFGASRGLAIGTSSGGLTAPGSGRSAGAPTSISRSNFVLAGLALAGAGSRVTPGSVCGWDLLGAEPSDLELFLVTGRGGGGGASSSGGKSRSGRSGAT